MGVQSLSHVGRALTAGGAVALIIALIWLSPTADAAEEALPEDGTPHAADHVLVKVAPGVDVVDVLGHEAEPVVGEWQELPVSPGDSPEEFVDELETLPGVEAAELDYLMQIDPVEPQGPISAAALSVDDPLYGFQWHFPAIQLADGWELSTGAGATVAVVDTGISADGDDLACHVFVSPYNAITETAGMAAAQDDRGHGTHVAGTVAQCTNNTVGVAGVAFDASLMPVKVLDANGNGTTASVARGIDWARTHGADVINLSLSGGSSQMLDDAIEEAVADGIVVVAAAGNSSTGTVAYPARHPDVIAVGATEFNNALAPYSNWGTALDVVAPGGDNTQDSNGDGRPDGVLQETFVGSDWGYFYFQGTSMATPHVAGAAALLKSVAPGLDGAGVRAILTQTALDLGPSGFDPTFGHGLLRVLDALEHLIGDDNDAPSWPAGAALKVESVSTTRLRLSWPDAIDNKVVAGYRIYRDGAQVATAAGTANSVLLADLASLTKYTFSVRAEDQSGNLSSPLARTATTPDGTPPQWPTTATAKASPASETELIVSWNAATDNVDVTGYLLRFLDLAEYNTSSRQAEVSGLQPGKDYPIEVLARDAAGNWSSPMRTWVRTPRTFRDTEGHTFYTDVLWMSGRDITRGCNPPVNDLFCPDDPVTRGQMAAFVVRMLGLSVNSHAGFGDVAASSTFAGDIGKLATAGITRGCNPPVNDRFCPDDPITRGELAAFLRRAMG